MFLRVNFLSVRKFWKITMQQGDKIDGKTDTGQYIAQLMGCLTFINTVQLLGRLTLVNTV